MDPSRTFHTLTGFSKCVDGRPLEFQDTAAALPTCAVCGLVPAEAYTLTCKHIFCPACFTGIVRETRTCPVDDSSFLAKKALRSSGKTTASVLQRVVFCVNKTSGCSFFGAVEAMLEHYTSCPYLEVTCQLCQASVLRANVASHVLAAHAKHATRKGRNKPTNSLAAQEASAVVATSSTAFATTEARDVPAVQPLLSTQELLKSIGELISRSTDDIRKTQELHLTRVLDSINSLQRPPHDTPGKLCFASPQLSTAYAKVLDVVGGKERKTGEPVPYPYYRWSVSPFSRLRVGVHYFSSDVFAFGPGYSAQLKGCIDGIATVELKVQVSIWAITGAKKGSGDYQLLDDAKACVFKTVNNNRPKDCLFVTYLLEEAFRESALPLDNPDGATSRWMDVGVVDRTVFERDFIEDDAFVVIFGIVNKR